MALEVERDDYRHARDKTVVQRSELQREMTLLKSERDALKMRNQELVALGRKVFLSFSICLFAFLYVGIRCKTLSETLSGNCRWRLATVFKRPNPVACMLQHMVDHWFTIRLDPFFFPFMSDFPVFLHTVPHDRTRTLVSFSLFLSCPDFPLILRTIPHDQTRTLVYFLITAV